MPNRPFFCAWLLAATLAASAVPAHAGGTEGQPPSVLPTPATPMMPVEPPLKPADVPQPVIPPVEPEPPQPNPGLRNGWQYIVIHHSASPSGNAASFDRMHKKKGWDGLAYHFVINNGKGGADGKLEVGQRWWKQKHGAHAGGIQGITGDERNEYNEFGIGICLVGNLDKKPPTRAQLKTLAHLLKKLQAEFSIPEENIVGHRHVKSTACPGRHFPWKKLWAMMQLPAPTHLVKRYPSATTDHCPWCQGSEVVASRDPRGAAFRGNSSVTPAAAELPPPIMLQGR